ncbi:hypothetical protein Acr_05g0014740 [Actinidia rufa]|uniref:Uncharacterized protein n=1 Tax=Actinidia rufa TaxID=165716 RepID=A0A7J0EMW0_9ERIC|nr:hypothetical protein Acr_05g0014740 [Actinidia rufa]
MGNCSSSQSDYPNANRSRTTITTSTPDFIELKIGPRRTPVRYGPIHAVTAVILRTESSRLWEESPDKAAEYLAAMDELLKLTEDPSDEDEDRDSAGDVEARGRVPSHLESEHCAA